SYISIRRQRDRAETEAQTSAAVNEFLAQMLTATDPRVAQGHSPTLDELLDRAAARIDTAFPARPEVRAAIQLTIGKTDWSLARYPEAKRLLGAAVEGYRKTLGDDHPKTFE